MDVMCSTLFELSKFSLSVWDDKSKMNRYTCELLGPCKMIGVGSNYLGFLIID